MEEQLATGTEDSQKPSQKQTLLKEIFSYYGIQPVFAFFGLGFAMCYCYSSQRLACAIFDGWFQIAQYCGMTLAGLVFALIGF